MDRCYGACAEVDSDTEAVAGKGFKLGCISCKMRSEVDGSATVEWRFRPQGEADFFLVSAGPSRKCRRGPRFVMQASSKLNPRHFSRRKLLIHRARPPSSRAHRPLNARPPARRGHHGVQNGSMAIYSTTEIIKASEMTHDCTDLVQDPCSVNVAAFIIQCSTAHIRIVSNNM